MSSRLQDIAMKRKINGLIKLLSEAVETPTTITPELNTFDAQLKDAPNAAQIKVPSKDLTFAKRAGEWFITGAGISNDRLKSILNNKGQKKLVSAAKDKTVNFEESDFIEPVKAVNFIRDNPGAAWQDNTPVEPAIIKKYMFADAVGDIGVSAASPGNALVHRDSNLTYVLLGSTFNVMAPGRDLSATNPLEAAKQLLIGAGFDSLLSLSTPGALTQKFIDIIDQKQELGLNLDRLPEAGALQDALRSARTIAGKFADLFSQDDIKVNFAVTEFGPALTRRKVAGRRTEALTASDAAKLEGTGYFKYESLPSTGQAKYKIGKSASETADVTVTGETVAGLDEVTDPSGATITNTFGSALYLYIKGRLKFAGETQQSITSPDPSPTPAADKTHQQKWLEILGPLPQPAANDGDKPGGIFFKFNTNNTDQAFPANYIDEVKKKVVYLSRRYQDFKKIDDKIDPGFKIVVIATGDPIGNDQANVSVSTARATSIKTQLVNETNDFVNLEISVLGEKLWKDVNSMQLLVKPTQANKAALKYARFGTVYLVGKNAAEADYKAIALDFFKRHKGTAEFTDISESYRANLINEIRRIIKETK